MNQATLSKEKEVNTWMTKGVQLIVTVVLCFAYQWVSTPNNPHANVYDEGSSNGAETLLTGGPDPSPVENGYPREVLSVSTGVRCPTWQKTSAFENDETNRIDFGIAEICNGQNGEPLALGDWYFPATATGYSQYVIVVQFEARAAVPNRVALAGFTLSHSEQGGLRHSDVIAYINSAQWETHSIAFGQPVPPSWLNENLHALCRASAASDGSGTAQVRNFRMIFIGID